MCSHSSPDRERRTVPLKRSTADSSIYAGPRWDSATSRITSRGVCSSPVASDRFYTLNYDAPIFFFRKLQMSVKDCECNDNATCTTRIVVVVLFSGGLSAASGLMPHPRWARRRGGPADAGPPLFQRPIGPLDSGQKLVGV